MAWFLQLMKMGCIMYLFYTDKAWNKVSKTSVSNWLKHAGFCPSKNNDEPLSEHHVCTISDEVDCVMIDNDVAEIVSEVSNSNPAGTNNEDSEGGELEVQTEAPKAINLFFLYTHEH